MAFNKVNAIYKCFDILDLLSRSKGPMGTSEIASSVNLNKSTVYNILNSLKDLGLLNKTENKYSFGARLFVLGRTVDYESILVRRVRPYLEKFCEQNKLTVSLGIRSGMKLVILERIEKPGAITVSMKGGRIRPLLDGAYGKAVLSLLPDAEIEEILKGHDLVKRTSKTVTDKKKYLEMVQRTRREAVAIDREEFYDGIWAVAVPFYIPNLDMQAVIWAFGLELRVNERSIRSYANALKAVVAEVETCFDIMDTPNNHACIRQSIRSSRRGSKLGKTLNNKGGAQ